MRFLFVIALLATPVIAQPTASIAQPSKHIAKILARTDGSSAEKAYKVSSVKDEYDLVRALGLTVQEQALAMKKDRPFDILTVVDPVSGKTRDIWFDISSFYPEFSF